MYFINYFRAGLPCDWRREKRCLVRRRSDFSYFLPKAVITQKTDIQQQPDLKIISKDKIAVLFVDDEEMIVKLARQSLNQMGYCVDCYNDSKKALTAFQTEPYKYDVMITDQTMPKLTGTQLADEVLHIRPEFPIILCTGFSETINEKIAKEMGITKFLHKPLELIEMDRSIREVVSRDRVPVVEMSEN